MWVTVSYYIDMETGERLSRDDYLKNWERVTPEIDHERIGYRYYKYITYNLVKRKPRQLDLFNEDLPF